MTVHADLGTMKKHASTQQVPHLCGVWQDYTTVCLHMCEQEEHTQIIKPGENTKTDHLECKMYTHIHQHNNILPYRQTVAQL